MVLFRGFLDRVVLLLAVLAGGSVPSFVNQYQQRVGGQLDQVTLDLVPFQQIADRYHDGSIDSLIQHHLTSSDPTFYAEGEAIQAMLDSAERLRHMVAALDTDTVGQLNYLVMHYDANILNATFQNFEPAFSMTTDALLIAACVGLVVWLLFLLSWRLTGSMGRGLVRAAKVVKT